MNRTNVKMSAFWVPTDCEILQAKLHFVSTSFALFMHISSWHFNHMHEHNINVNIPYVYYSIRHRIFICVRHISLSAHFSASFQNFSYILIALKKIFHISLLKKPCKYLPLDYYAHHPFHREHLQFTTVNGLNVTARDVHAEKGGHTTEKTIAEQK